MSSLNKKSNEITCLISPPILMSIIHKHPLLYCHPLERKNYSLNWSCDICKSNNLANQSSFYCTFCDFDLCPKCLGECQIDKIKFYNSNSNESKELKNIEQNQNDFKWQKKFKNHKHLLTLIEKENKDSLWICDNCSKSFTNINSSYYCSLCDYDLCKNCYNEKPEIIPNPNPIIPNPIFPNPLNQSKISDFQIKSFKILNQEYKNKNLIYSPLTLQILLGLLSNGLTGKSLEEIKNVLLYQDLQSQNNLLNNLSKIPSLNIANAVFCPIPYLPNFNTYISNFKAIFSKNKDELNQFIKKNTNNKVINYFDKTIIFGLVFANILYFKEEWKKKFDECLFQKSFYIKENKEKQVKMINVTDNFKYYKDKSIEMIEIPYKVDGLLACILLPNKNFPLDDLINQLDQEKIDKLINNSILKKIDLTMPKFSFLQKDQINLENALKKIGINSIFSTFSSDFTKPFQNPNNISINTISQANFIEVDEKGNENNVFSIENQPLTNAKNMVVDRPFLFIIRSNNFEKGKDIILIVKIEEIQ